MFTESVFTGSGVVSRLGLMCRQKINNNKQREEEEARWKEARNGGNTLPTGSSC